MNSVKTIILRGAQGFGKTTYTKKVLPRVLDLNPLKILICSADHFFMNIDGTYDWKPSLLSKAHEECRRQFLMGLHDGDYEAVVVDNTNINKMDMAYYWGLGTLFGPVEFHQLEVDPKIAGERNIHGVDPAKVVLNAERLKMSPVPKFWRPTIITVKSVDQAFVVDGKEYKLN